MNASNIQTFFWLKNWIIQYVNERRRRITWIHCSLKNWHIFSRNYKSVATLKTKILRKRFSRVCSLKLFSVYFHSYTSSGSSKTIRCFESSNAYLEWFFPLIFKLHVEHVVGLETVFSNLQVFVYAIKSPCACCVTFCNAICGWWYRERECVRVTAVNANYWALPTHVPAIFFYFKAFLLSNSKHKTFRFSRKTFSEKTHRTFSVSLWKWNRVEDEKIFSCRLWELNRPWASQTALRNFNR